MALFAIAVLVLGLVGAFDGTMRRHSRALASEWWSCLVARTPPALAHELPRPADDGVTAAAGLSPGALSPRHLLARTRAGRLSEEGLASITIAVVDSGIEDPGGLLAAAPLSRGLDTVNPCSDGRWDPSGHGTAVAGVIASEAYGAARGVTILPVRTSLSTGVQLRWANAAAIVWATNNGADIVNLSNSSNSASPSWVEHAAVRYATARGVVVVASAGNRPGRSAGYPAAYPEVIGVTSVDGANRLSVFAARKGQVDLAAPGTRIQTLDRQGRGRVVSGTSFATPFVSAVVARMLAVNPDLRPGQVRDILVSTAVPLPAEYTAVADRPFGVIDIDSALVAAGLLLPPPAQRAATPPFWVGLLE